MISLTTEETELIIQMDGVPGCYLRAHMMPAGKRVKGFRLLDRNKNPLRSVRYSIVETLVQGNFLEPIYQGGVLYHYYRTEKKLNRYAK